MAETFDYVEYPKILSQPDADPEALVSEALATFMDRNDLKGCKVAIAVPGQAGLVKFIKLPPVEKKRIPDIVKFEARQQIPFALEEVVWAYQQIGGDDEDSDEDFTMAEVGLFAMKRDQINRAIAAFQGRPASRSTSSRWGRSPFITTSPSTSSRGRGLRARSSCSTSGRTIPT